MVMKLYGQGNIFNVQRAILPLFELEVDTEKELELVMPFAQIPYFEDGDVTIFESRAIARYIVEKYDGQGSTLLGKTLQERAAINQWVESEAHNLYPPLRPMMKEIYVAMMMKRATDDELIDKCTTELAQVLDVYEAYLAKSGRDYLAGLHFTLADLCHTPYLYQVKLYKGEVLEGRPHVAAYTDRITA